MTVYFKIVFKHVSSFTWDERTVYFQQYFWKYRNLPENGILSSELTNGTRFRKIVPSAPMEMNSDSTLKEKRLPRSSSWTRTWPIAVSTWIDWRSLISILAPPTILWEGFYGLFGPCVLRSKWTIQSRQLNVSGLKWTVQTEWLKLDGQKWTDQNDPISP